MSMDYDFASLKARDQGHQNPFKAGSYRSAEVNSQPLTAAQVLAIGVSKNEGLVAERTPFVSEPQPLKPPLPFDPLTAALHGMPKLESLVKTEAIDESSAAGALLGLHGNKLSHNQVEHNRRLKAKQLFDELKLLLPGGEDPLKVRDRNALLKMAVDVMKALQSYVSKIESNMPECSALHHETKTESKENSGTDDEAQFRTPGNYSEVLAGLNQSGAEQAAFAGMEMDLEGGDQDRKLSHSEAEQRRRQIARNYYNELRAFLPGNDKDKLDKNAVLQRTIFCIKQAAAAAAAAAQAGKSPLEDHSHSEDDTAMQPEHGLSESPPDVVRGFLAMVASGASYQARGLTAHNVMASSALNALHASDDSSSQRTRTFSNLEDAAASEETTNARLNKLMRCDGSGKQPSLGC